MALNITLPEYSHLSPRIAVIGVGGAGGNAVNNMIASELQGVEFITANTDAQALDVSHAPRKVQLGPETTQGLGAGRQPEVGRAAAEESLGELTDLFSNTHMLFIAAGMGGGTGTGAAPVIARLARDMGILTVGVVTKPFQFEGGMRKRVAEDGIAEMQQHVNTLIVIPNQNLFRIANEKTTCTEAFAMADEVLQSGVRGVTDLIVVPGRVNLDFSDIRTVMTEMGKAMMGTGEAEGEGREIAAAEAAISNPLLEDMSLQGAKDVLINVTSGDDLTLFEIDKAVNRVGEEAGPNANIMFGSVVDPALQGRVRVSVVATGIGEAEVAQPSVSGRGAGAEVAVLSRFDNSRRAGVIGPAVHRLRREEQPAPAGQDEERDEAPAPSFAGSPSPQPVEQRPAVARPVPVQPVQLRPVSPQPAAQAAPEPTPLVEPVSEPVEPEEIAPEEPAPATSAGDRDTGAEEPAKGAANLFGDEAAPKEARRPGWRFNLFGQGGNGAKKPVVSETEERPEPTVRPAVVQEVAPPEERRLEGLDPQDRIRTSEVDDDLLQIPAFLRRQAN